MTGLEAMGWNATWEQAFAALPGAGLRPGRVVLEHGRFLRVWNGTEEQLAVPSGRLRHESRSAAELPTVGDWVALQKGESDLGSIRHVLPRKSRFSRRRVGARVEEQVVAANVNTVFLMMGLDEDFNLRRLERYLTLASGSGARPVVVLNKADLAPDREAQCATVQALAPGVPVLTTSLLSPEGVAPVAAYVAPTETIALLGSSGVGKSMLINCLLGAEVQRTGAVRASDGRGRHTTTYAQLFVLPGGGLVVDTPGMRELQLWDTNEGQGMGVAFDDIERTAAECRFRDCHHAQEPGCAVRVALEQGAITRERFASFQKLRAELGATAGGRRRR